MRTSKILTILAISLLLAAFSVSAMRNPSAVYCTELGYNYTVDSGEEGDIGYCTLPDGGKVDAWQFLQGYEGTDYNYCEAQGYETKVVNSTTTCEIFLTGSCAVCILDSGKEVEVTKLMGLTFAETTCGDGHCGVPENHKTCPVDCKKAGPDGYCEGGSDSICDPDCGSEKDLDCPVLSEEEKASALVPESSGGTFSGLSFPKTAIYIVIAVLAMVVIAVVMYKLGSRKVKRSRKRR
jgi:putative hemolysin